MTACEEIASSEAAAQESSGLWKSLPLSPSHWSSAYDGLGSIDFQARSVSLSPRAPASSHETHAALVLSRDELSPPYKVRVVYRNVRPLRSPTANPWEVFWLFFDYRVPGTGTGTGTKETNYFILKPNGVELGRAFGEVDQVFLHTASDPVTYFGARHELVLSRGRDSVSVSIDGAEALRFTDATWPRALYSAPGKLGLYTEDAHVVIETVELLESSAP